MLISLLCITYNTWRNAGRIEYPFTSLFFRKKNEIGENRMGKCSNYIWPGSRVYIQLISP